jgi:hypothetical protein
MALLNVVTSSALKVVNKSNLQSKPRRCSLIPVTVFLLLRTLDHLILIYSNLMRIECFLSVHFS